LVSGVDPSDAMLGFARGRLHGNRVEWIKGRATDFEINGQFELIVMTGHAFQVLVSDTDVLDALKHLRAHLSANGRLAFETRNGALREWADWTPAATRQMLSVPDVGNVEVHNDIRSVSENAITYETHFRFGPDDVVVTEDTIRFMEEKELDQFLATAGFLAVSYYGAWNGSMVKKDSQELIVIAR
jgi:ubiquinone/menaquinone biosynthesis C-methylase UbiE